MSASQIDKPVEVLQCSLVAVVVLFLLLFVSFRLFVLLFSLFFRDGTSAKCAQKNLREI